MKKTKLSPKNEYIQKRKKENPTIEKKDFMELFRRAVQPLRPSPKQPA